MKSLMKMSTQNVGQFIAKLYNLVSSEGKLTYTTDVIGQIRTWVLIWVLFCCFLYAFWRN